MGISSKTGFMSRCRAKDPDHCRFHAPGSHVAYDQSVMDKFNEDHYAEQQGKKSKTLRKSGQGGEGDADHAATTERITTLLTEKIDLKDDRVGKVPSLKDDDGPVAGVTKLGRYIEANYNGDRDADSMQALSSIFGRTVTPINDLGSDENQDLAASVRMMRKDPRLDPRCYQDEKGDGYIVTLRTPGKWLKSYASYRRSGRGVHLVNLGQMLATDSALKTIPFNDLQSDRTARKMKRELSFEMLDKERKWSTLEQIVDDSDIPPTALLDVTMKTLKHVDSNHDRSYEETVKQYNDLIEDQGNGLDIRQRQQLRREKYDLPYTIIHARAHVMDYLSDTLDDERNGEMNRAYAVRVNHAHSATVYEDKKGQDAGHVQAAARSAFRKDFKHIEIDDSVDLDKFSSISDEYDAYRSVLPKERVKADFRFRKTGRHHATGVYTPSFRNISVDPRSPGSFTHEYFHHLDFTNDPNGRQLSMDPGFRGIVKDYQARLDRAQVGGADINRFIAPTEIFARAGELWMVWKHGSSSFTHSGERYDHEFDYAPLLAHKNEIIKLFDSTFLKTTPAR
jgi:hypothetical protein